MRRFNVVNALEEEWERPDSSFDTENEDDYLDSAASSSDDDFDDNSRFLTVGIQGLVSSLRHRNGTARHETRINTLSSDEENGKRKCRRRVPRTVLRRLLVICQVYQRDFPLLCNRFSTIICLACFLIWLLCILLHPWTKSAPEIQLPIRERSHMRTHHRAHRHKRSAVRNFFHDAAEGFWDLAGATKKRKKRSKGSQEDLMPGCVRSEWQTYSFPTCNEILSIDLASVLKRQRKQSKDNTMTLGYLNSGHWRDVWAVDPSAVMTKPAVLKTMKGEHELNDRNFDRHRRDAIAMERLSLSPYVVDIYGFCGNSVLTEFIPTTLADIIFDDYCPEGAHCPTRQTEEGRLRLALDTARGVKAIHEIPKGGIAHTDLQAKQFLVREDGVVALNDFNRCRFVAHRNATGELCPFHIASAPGKHRSPEEYNFGGLDTKLDIYSLANVYYAIITGTDAWEDWSGTETKQHVTSGVIPKIPHEFRQPGSSDQALTELTYRAYALDPRDRISASELVKEVENLLTNFTQQTR